MPPTSWDEFVQAITVIIAGVTLIGAAAFGYAAILAAMALAGVALGVCFGVVAFVAMIGLALFFGGCYMLGESKTLLRQEQASGAAASINSSIIAGFPAGEAIAIASLGLEPSDD